MILTERLKLFSDELKLIKSFSIKKFVMECLAAAPDYIFTNCPSSSTGKYHAIDEFTPLGNILHTKRVVDKCNIIARAFNLAGKDKDLVLAAAILHDMVKQGFKKTGYTVDNHAALAAQLVEKVFRTTKSKISIGDYKIIRDCVFYHNGVWTPEPDNIPITSFTIHQLCVHMADYAATQFYPMGCGMDKNDIFVEFKNFVELFKTKLKFNDVTDIPIMLGKFFGAVCINIKNTSVLEDKLMTMAALCIKGILYLRLNK